PALDCPTEEKAIRKLLAEFHIQRLEFNLSQHQIKVSAPTSLQKPIIEALTQHGFSVASDTLKTPASPYKKLGVAAAFALTAELIHFFIDIPWLAALFALVAISLGGLRTYQLGWQALKQGKL